VKDIPALKGDRQYIAFDPVDKLACVTELVRAVAGWSMRRFLLVPTDAQQAKKVLRALTASSISLRFAIHPERRTPPDISIECHEPSEITL